MSNLREVVRPARPETALPRLSAPTNLALTEKVDGTMRKFAFFLLLASIALPAFAAKRINVEQLEQVLAAAQGKPDAQVALQLSNLELNERFSSLKLSHWKASLPGEQAQQALVALADQSAFLDPPTAEIPSAPAPDLTTQRRMLALTVSYIGRTIPQLPNFIASRVTTSFADTPLQQNLNSTFTPYQPLHLIGNSTATVLYRDGQEVIDARASKEKQSNGLTAWGAFGPILGTVLVDAARSKLTWSHWERGASGLQAVYGFVVPKDKSHYSVNFCCVAAQAATRVADLHPFSQLAAYHGEMAIDPASGTVLRLMLVADMKPDDPVVKSGIVVEYGTVEIGGRTYFCPIKSISSTQAQTLQFNPRYLTPVAEQLQPLKTWLNNVSFEQYHVFRAETNVVAGNEPLPAGKAPAPALAVSEPVASEPREASNPVSPTIGQTPAQASAGHKELSTTSGAPPEQESAEISVADATGVPDAPANSHPAMSGAGFTLRTTARLVDVGVVASDKKGHPVTDLKPADFEIYDNGRKQEVRYFSQAAGAASQPPEQAAAEPNHAEGAEIPSTFSNRRAPSANGNAAAATSESSVTILLMDGSNLAFGDLTNARNQTLQFLKNLPTNERVGLYVMKSAGYQILAEDTADRALLEAKLAQWTPSAQDLAHAQDEERRNRQQIEEVHHVSDLASVNGNTTNEPQAQGESLDWQVRDFGANPGRDALAILVGVARHLAALPGHKSLVWVTSDNVLADWSNQSVSIGKESKFIEPFALRAQEAMNDAHVSVYPLDASQLEAGTIDASIQHRNVELTPAAQDNAQMMGKGGSSSGLEGQDIAVGRDMRPGRITAQMQQDLHPIQGPIRHLAEATGGRIFRRSGSVAEELNGVVGDGHAAYLLSFTPDLPADDKYHLLTVKIAGRRDIALRYRTGYQYDKEPTTLKERFRKAVWQPTDVAEIALTAKPLPLSKGVTLKLNIAATDLDLAQQGELWSGKIDVFLVERDDSGLHAKVTGQTLGFRLKPATYQRLMRDGIPLEQSMEIRPGSGSVRILVVDESSGRMGSVTIPAGAIGEEAKTR